MIPESQDRITVAIQEAGSLIVFGVFGVLLAIKLHDEVCRPAKKMGHIRTDGDLANELEAAEFTSAQPSPEASLGIGFVSPELAGAKRGTGSTKRDVVPPHRTLSKRGPNRNQPSTVPSPGRFATRPLPHAGEVTRAEHP
jgi:hypothetical protein